MLKLLKALFGLTSSKVAIVPDGYVLVPEKPSEEHIESMCLRYDHSHNFKHSLPVDESDEDFLARRLFNRRVVQQLYEEATGQGYYKLTQTVGPDWMTKEDLVALQDGAAKVVVDDRSWQPTVLPGMSCNWVSAKNSHVQNGSVCLACWAIDSREPEEITGCAKDLVESLQDAEVEAPLTPLEDINPELHDCTRLGNTYYFECRSCGENTEVYDPEKFDPSMHYCGRSPRCCP